MTTSTNKPRPQGKGYYPSLKSKEIYFTERTEVMLSICYEEAMQARAKWRSIVMRDGINKACKKINNKPTILGKLKGKDFLNLGLMVSPDRETALEMLRELPSILRKQHLASVESAEAEKQFNRDKEPLTLKTLKQLEKEDREISAAKINLIEKQLGKEKSDPIRSLQKEIDALREREYKALANQIER